MSKLEKSSILEATENRENKENKPKSRKSKNGKSVPTIDERLAFLRPSKELLEYYRRKVAEYDEERIEVLQKLDDYQSTVEKQHKFEGEVRQREDEISELQKALSDMQLYLFQEREQVLKLYAENDRLKIQELEDRKKIHKLLSLRPAGELVSGDSDVTYFFQEPPAKLVTAHGNSTSCEKGKASQKAEKEPESSNSESLRLQIEALQTQLEEQTKLAKEQVDALLEDRRIRAEEYEAARRRDAEKVKSLAERLKKTQELLHENTKDYLEAKFECRKKEREFMSEKDRLLRELEKWRAPRDDREERRILSVSHAQPFVEKEKQYCENIEKLKSEMEQAHKLADLYREQVVQLEDQVSRVREEGDVTKEVFKERSDKMAKRLKLMNDRYKELERRRNLEIEGFKNDTKLLRQTLKDVERKMFKATVELGENPDVRMLTNVKEAASRSRKIQQDLQHLKRRVYEMENDLRHL